MEPQQTVWQKVVSFIKRHPVLFNFLAIILTLVILVWLLGVVFLGFWTNHGDTVSIPQVKGLQVEVAADALRRGGFEVMFDSIYDVNSRPGMVVEQSPHENSKVKEGRTVYLRYVCYTPKMVKVPSYDSRSERSVKTELESMGITNITVKYMPAQNPNVLGLRYNGLLLRPGDEIPVGANITMEVGQVPETEQYYVSEEENIYQEDEDARFLQQFDFDF